MVIVSVHCFPDLQTIASRGRPHSRGLFLDALGRAHAMELGGAPIPYIYNNNNQIIIKVAQQE